MAASTNFMIFVPTAVDALLQAQGVNTGTAPANNCPNLGLWQALSNPAVTRTATGSVGTATGAGATVNTLGGAIYQGDMGALIPIWEFLRQFYEAR